MEGPAAGQETTQPVCHLVKPEPRTIKPDQCSCISDHPDASTRGPNIPAAKSDLPSSFSSEPSVYSSDVRAKTTPKARWTSSPPSRRDSCSAASARNKSTGDSTAVCPDAGAGKVTDSPVKRKGNSAFTVTYSDTSNSLSTIIYM